MGLQEVLSHDLTIRVFVIVAGVLVSLILVKLIRRTVNARITDIDAKYKVRKTINIFGYVLVVSVVLFVFSDSLGGLGVALGVAGAGIAFALQELIASLAGWFVIMFGNVIKIGQRVKIGETKGDVIDIGLLKTSIMEVGDWIKGDLYNGRIATLANSFVFKQPVQNYSAEYPFLWDELTVPIRHGSDFKLARDVFRSVLVEVCGDFARASGQTWDGLKNKYRVEKANIEPSVTLKFDENWITFTLRYIVDFQKRRGTKDLIYSRLLEEIQRHHPNISIASAAIEVTHMTTMENKA